MKMTATQCYHLVKFQLASSILELQAGPSFKITETPKDDGQSKVMLDRNNTDTHNAT
jgi:hypothetical protein